MKITSHFKRGMATLIVFMIFLTVGFEIFQGQKSIESPVKQDMFDYDESNPYIDRPTREALTHVVAKDDADLDMITDANGFDNFEIGVDFAEQMLVSNPRNPLNMQFGVNNSSTGQNAYYTINGYDWTQSNPSYNASICCDPWSAFDSLGNLFYGSGVTGQYVYKSLNGGQTYGAGVLSVNGNDRNTLAADQTGGPYANFLYAAITPGNFTRSMDNGATWTQTYAPSNTVPGTMIAVGPNGAVQGGCVMYVTNTGTTQNVTYTFHRSTNGGANFTVMSSLTVAGYVGTLNTAGRLVINNGRTRPYPMIAMDNSYGPNRGRLYLIYASNVPAGNGNKPDIILQYSTNQGSTWSSRITVNDNANPQLSDQWFPAIWCEKETGRLYIKWYDTRENPATYTVNVYATYSDDGGTTFAPNQKLTTTSWTYPNPSCAANTNCYRGDYDGMTANTKAGFAVWYDGRSGTYKNVGSYFPDFGMLASPASQTVNQTNDSRNFSVSIPAVKLYTDVTTFSATVTPAPSTGSFQVEFLGGNTLSSYPDSKFLKVKTVGTVTPVGNYTVNIVGQGSNGTPVHKRTVTLTVNTSVGAAPCDDFSGVKFPPASMYEEYSGTNYWTSNSVSAYGIGSGSARFDFYNASVGTVQSIVSNNFTNAAANTYLTFDEAYAPHSSSFGPDTLLVESSTNFGTSFSELATLIGRGDGTGELNTAPATTSSFIPLNSQWRPKIYTLPAGTNKVRLKAKSGFGNNLYIDNLCVQVLSAPVISSIGVFPQGFFRTGPSIVSDTVNISLRRTDFPNVAVDSAKVTYSTSAVAVTLLSRALTGQYYVVVKHRNSIETWSKAGGQSYTRGAAFIFDFVNNILNTYGSNQALVSGVFYGMFGGDIEQNGFIDLNDITLVYNDAGLFATGYLVTDVTGDNLTDLSDLLITYNNNADFVTVKKPAGAEPEPSPNVESDFQVPVFENDAQREKYESGLKIRNEMKISSPLLSKPVWTKDPPKNYKYKNSNSNTDANINHKGNVLGNP
ncbi:MAG TPA: sialidase family protein [Ignavibacteria bacterium]|nr:sialidase family protein [Ignavibacteria bacterium]